MLGEFIETPVFDVPTIMSDSVDSSGRGLAGRDVGNPTPIFLFNNFPLHPPYDLVLERPFVAPHNPYRMPQGRESGQFRDIPEHAGSSALLQTLGLYQLPKLLGVLIELPRLLLHNDHKVLLFSYNHLQKGCLQIEGIRTDYIYQTAIILQDTFKKPSAGNDFAFARTNRLKVQDARRFNPYPLGHYDPMVVLCNELVLFLYLPG
jgi:hypothetical protein